MKVLGILQEFATTVGNLNSIDILNTMGAGYGCQIISEFQDLNQLKTLKPNGWQTYLANAGFQIYMATGAGDLFTSDHISRMTGTMEVTSISRSGVDQPGNPLQVPMGILGTINMALSSVRRGPQINTSQVARRYMLPEQVCEMGGDEMLVFAEGVRGVIRAGRKPYYETPEFAGRYDEDPYHATKSKRRSA